VHYPFTQKGEVNKLRKSNKEALARVWKGEVSDNGRQLGTITTWCGFLLKPHMTLDGLNVPNWK